MHEYYQKKQIPTLYCIYGKEAYFTCAQKTCNKNSLICLTKDCECHQQNHKKCLTIRLKTIIDQVLAKKVSMSAQVTKSYKEILKIYEQMIETLSRQREYLVDNMEYYGLKKYQKEFLSRIQSNQTKLLSGMIIYQLLQQLKSKKKNSSIYSVENIREKWQKNIKKNLEKCYSEANNLLINDSLKLTSKITKNCSLVQKTLGKMVLQFNLLYRASENKFQTSKFHQNCDNFSNTLVLIKTQNNDILGGFTPIPWDNPSNQYFIQDLQNPNNEIFNFVIYQKENKGQYQKKGGIFLHKNCGPTFGWGFSENSKRQYRFLINDNSNTKACVVNTKRNKLNENTNNRISFNSESDTYQKIIEWQVFEVVFYSGTETII